MAVTLATANIDLSLKGLSGVTAGLRRVGDRLAGLATKGFKIAATAGAAVGGAFLTMGVRAAVAAEQAEVAFEVMLGSAERAKALLGELTAFAAATPFRFPEIRKGAQALLAFGSEAEEIIPTLTTLGDIAAGVGQPIDELAVIFGKAKIAGRLMAEDVNQLVERGIPVITEFAKILNVSAEDVKKLVSEGAVTFPILEQAFQNMTRDGGRFAGLMERMSRTTGGLFSTMQDDIEVASRDLAIQLLPKIKELIATVQDSVPAITSWGNIFIDTLQGIAEGAAIVANFIDEAFSGISGPGVEGGFEVLSRNFLDSMRAGFLSLAADAAGSDVLGFEKAAAILKRASAEYENSILRAEEKRANDRRAKAPRLTAPKIDPEKKDDTPKPSVKGGLKGSVSNVNAAFLATQQRLLEGQKRPGIEAIAKAQLEVEKEHKDDHKKLAFDVSQYLASKYNRDAKLADLVGEKVAANWKMGN